MERKDATGRERIIIPLDTQKIEEAIETVVALKSHVGMFKIGLELITSIIVQAAITNDNNYMYKIHRLFELTAGQLFWDGKWNDIPTL
jgi:orotidine-5'-phosphate decarboxylase